MLQKMLITNFNYNVSHQEYKNISRGLGQSFADVPGCVWKIWLINEAKKEAGAVYLFDDEAALQTFKESKLVADVLSHPALGNFDLQERDILTDVSKITRAPLQNISEVTF